MDDIITAGSAAYAETHATVDMDNTQEGDDAEQDGGEEDEHRRKEEEHPLGVPGPNGGDGHGGDGRAGQSVVHVRA